MDYLAQKIKAIRQDLGLSMEEFGKLFDPPASKGVVSNWENAYNKPNNERLKKIAQLANTTIEYLLSERENTSSLIPESRVYRGFDKIQKTFVQINLSEDGEFQKYSLQIFNQINQMINPDGANLDISSLKKLNRLLALFTELSIYQRSVASFFFDKKKYGEFIEGLTHQYNNDNSPQESTKALSKAGTLDMDAAVDKYFKTQKEVEQIFNELFLEKFSQLYGSEESDDK